MKSRLCPICQNLRPISHEETVRVPYLAKPTSPTFQAIIRRGVTRLQLSKILTEFESGKHLESPGVETVAVTAFKLEPITPNGHLTLDGELIEYGPIEAEVLQGCARLMNKK